MRTQRVSAFVFVVLIALAALSMRSDVAAQDTTTQRHPLVGVWLADTDLESENALDNFLFSSDGSYLQRDANGSVSLGVWEATGEQTATLMIVTAEGDDDSTNYGTIIIRATIEVSADVNSFTAEYTNEFIDPNGTSTGEAGPGFATGERVVAEAQGTPVMSMEEMFSQMEDGSGESDGQESEVDEGDREATPVS